MPLTRVYPTLAAFTVLVNVGGIASAYAPEEAHSLEFSSTCAQIIPVLLLVLVIEARLFGIMEIPPPRGWRDWIVVVGLATNAAYVVGFMLYGELLALHPLSTGDANDGKASHIYASLAVGFTSVVLLLVFGRTTRRESD